MPLQLAFEALGDGPPVVVLHGLFGSSRNWRGVARALSAQHRVYCVDLRNHRRSPWTESMSYPEMAADVHALIRSWPTTATATSARWCRSASTAPWAT